MSSLAWRRSPRGSRPATRSSSATSARSAAGCRSRSPARNGPAADDSSRAGARRPTPQQGSPMFLSDISIKRPVFATMMMVALVVLGIVSYKRLAIDEYPDITYPVVVAQTSYPGASPEVMMREISKPIEEALNTVQGIKEINSSSLEGVSIVRLTFNLG